MIFESYQVSIHNFSSQNILIPNHELNWIDEFFCGMVDWQKAFSLISSWGHCQRSSPSRISNTPRAGFEPAQNLSSGLVEWSCAVVITTTPLIPMHTKHIFKTKFHLFLFLIFCHASMPLSCGKPCLFNKQCFLNICGHNLPSSFITNIINITTFFKVILSGNLSSVPIKILVSSNFSLFFLILSNIYLVLYIYLTYNHMII